MQFARGVIFHKRERGSRFIFSKLYVIFNNFTRSFDSEYLKQKLRRLIEEFLVVNDVCAATRVDERKCLTRVMCLYFVFYRGYRLRIMIIICVI